MTETHVLSLRVNMSLKSKNVAHAKTNMLYDWWHKNSDIVMEIKMKHFSKPQTISARFYSK